MGKNQITLWLKKIKSKSRLIIVSYPGLKAMAAFILWLYYRIFKSLPQFSFNGRKYHYFYHLYNYTWFGERVVEIPIVWKVVNQLQADHILEVGNVLSHYFPIHHTVVDRNEKAPGVINQDIVSFKPKSQYNLIISISTLEHVGWDDNPRQPEKFIKALNKLKSRLAPGGQIIATLPLGYNSLVDKLVKSDDLPFNQCFYLKRIKRDIWQQTSLKDVSNCRYSFPYPGANGLVVAFFQSKIS